MTEPRVSSLRLRARREHRRSPGTVIATVAVLVLGIGLPARVSAEAPESWERSDGSYDYGPRREGGQIEVLLGATACMPGQADCGVEERSIDGFTFPSFGTGVSLGWRANRYVLIGGAYRFGMFHPDYEILDVTDYFVAYQHSAYAFIRPIIPFRRLEIGVDLGPGYARQVFQRDEDRHDYADGFSFLIGPTLDVFVGDHFFVGAKVDFLLNAFDEICADTGATTLCREATRRDITPVHQMIYGLHLGGTFGG